MKFTICMLTVFSLAAATSASGQPASRPASRPSSRPTIHSVDPRFVDPETKLPDLDKVLDHYNDLFRADASISKIKFVITKPRRTRTMEMKVWTRGQEKALIRVEKPSRDRGTASLRVGENLWNYMPRISRTIRIPPSMMLSSWMGSDFTNDDIVRRSSLTEDFDYRLVGPSRDPAGWLVELKAKEGTVGLWDKIEYVTTPDATLPRLARYYDRKGRLARTMSFTDVKKFGKRRLPSHMVLLPHDKDKQGHKTELFYLEIDYDTEVPESTFSLSRLERGR